MDDANLAYLEMRMHRANLHEGLRGWLRIVYRLQGIKYACTILDVWESE